MCRKQGIDYPDLTPQEEWKQKIEQYAAAMNAFLERGVADCSQNTASEAELPDWSDLVEYALEAVRQANRESTTSDLREQWPPAPFLLLTGLPRAIPRLAVLDDDTVIARVGNTLEEGYVIQIVGDQVETIPDVDFFGSCPNRRYFAIAQTRGIAITDGWLGQEVCLCQWPTGTEDLPDGITAPPFDRLPAPSQLIPFPDGKRVLLISEKGVFVLSPNRAQRLLPTNEAIEFWFSYFQKGSPKAGLELPAASMAHGAVSEDGGWVVVGCQDGKHKIFNKNLELVGEVAPVDEYPSYALFNNNSSMVALTSTRFKSGITIGVSTSVFRGPSADCHESEAQFPILDKGASVMAGVSREGEFIVGGHGKYVRAISHTGEGLWQVFVGSAVEDIAISRSGKTLAVSTSAGFIQIIDLDAGKPPAYQIGTGNHIERRRWIFWENEETPLLW